MSISTLTYEPPVRRPIRRTVLDYEKLEAAVQLAGEGRPLESLTRVFEHFFPDRPAIDFQVSTFEFVQGSSQVTTRIDGDDLVISVPLVKLPAGGGAVAGLRHILTNISSTGKLYQPRLRGDDVHLEYRDRLSRLHPAKVVEVLRAMPDEADGNDDFMIGQFSAQPVDRVAAEPLTTDESARAEAIWRRHWADMEEIFKECQRKRSVWFLNETTAYAVHRILFALPLTGFLSWRLDDAARTFNDGNEEPTKREAALAKSIKDMKAVSPEELRRNLGHVTYAISPRTQGAPNRLGIIGPGHYIETIESLRTSGKTIDAALGMIGTYNYLLARFAWDEPVEVALREGLAKASGKPWREAAAILVEDAKALFAKYGEEEEEEEDEEDEEDEEAEKEEEGSDE